MPSPWSRIDAWLLVHAPPIFEELRPPASSVALARLAEVAGKPLPAGVISMYSAHDGAKGEVSAVLAAVRAPDDAQWARYMWLLSTEGSAEQLATMRDIGEWPEELLPFGLDAGGNLLVVELSSGKVSAWDHETWETTPLSSDLDAWFGALADDMERKLVAAPNLDPEEDLDDGRLMLLAAPPPLPPLGGPPVLAEDRAARVFIEVLEERKLAVLKKRVDIEPLVVALHEALAIKERAERHARVIGILEDSAAVDEIFASDDKIGILIEELT